jgi:hypothetical protein
MEGVVQNSVLVDGGQHQPRNGLRGRKLHPFLPEVKVRRSGQGLVEFALVLPILLLIFVGIVESARMFLIYASLTTASREASRYGASVGASSAGVPRFLDCAGMRDAARNLAIMSELRDSDIEIEFDHGDPSQPLAKCDSNPAENLIELGDRVVVTVHATYAPIVPLVPIPPIQLSSSTARTILKDIEAGPSYTPRGPTMTATALPTSTSTATATPEETTTAAAMETPITTPTQETSPTPQATRTAFPTPTALPIPRNFHANINNCNQRKVSFDWDPLEGADYYAIYKLQPPPAVQVAIAFAPPCKNCSTLPANESSRTYVIVAFFNGKESGYSEPATVNCP